MRCVPEESGDMGNGAPGSGVVRAGQHDVAQRIRPGSAGRGVVVSDELLAEIGVRLSLPSHRVQLSGIFSPANMVTMPDGIALFRENPCPSIISNSFRL